MRDVKQQPQHGDIVQIVPVLTDQQWPAPLKVMGNDGVWVHWTRQGDMKRTSLHFWQTSRLGMELVE